MELNIAPAGLVETHQGDARRLPLEDSTVDLVVTSPPYWRHRDYNCKKQIGQESTVRRYLSSMSKVMHEWKRVLRRTGSAFVNIGDTYADRSLVGVPAMLEDMARRQSWLVRNRIIWAKTGGVPSSARNRLPNRHEYILHLTVQGDYYYDLLGYAERLGGSVNSGDVWDVPTSQNQADHTAPFPEELVERAILLACPHAVCTSCGTASRRLVRPTSNLNPNRPQARRAMEIAQAAGLTEEHFAAIRATGISDAGKGARVQDGSGRNSRRVQVLAAEAKRALGGYFREFTFPLRETEGWTECGCRVATRPGIVLDTFAGTGTTLWVAERLGRRAIGVDLHPIVRPAHRRALADTGKNCQVAAQA